MTTIPIHRLQDHHSNGLYLRRVEVTGDNRYEVPTYSHRDDHYMIAVQEKGRTEFMLDFNPVVMSGASLACILPGQVHAFNHIRKASGWFLAFDPLLLEEPLRDVFENARLCTAPLPLRPGALHRLQTCLHLLLDQQEQNNDSPLARQVLYALLTSFLGMAATLYQERAGEHLQASGRPALITRQFRELLRRQFRSVKSPADYAAALHLSLSYLNESVKAVTGLNVSQCIQEEVILEARRLLYYSDQAVKEIAYGLGYEDQAYFSRVFRRVTGLTPVEFRAQYRESS